MINSRSKGSTGEREFARLVEQHLGIRLVRNLQQTRSGGCDLILDDLNRNPVAAWLASLAIEVKRPAKATPGLLAQWWEQTTRQAQDTGLMPCLAFREDRRAWRIRVPLNLVQNDLPSSWARDLEYTAEISVAAFAALAREAAEPWGPV